MVTDEGAQEGRWDMNEMDGTQNLYQNFSRKKKEVEANMVRHTTASAGREARRIHVS